MSNVIRAESPLVQSPSSSAAITEREKLGFINLRGDPTAGGAFGLAIKKVTGLAPSADPNKVIRSERYSLYWLGPDEYLLTTASTQVTETINDLQAVLDGVFSSVTDVSSGFCRLDIIGDYARDLVAKGCPLDLHASVFGEGDCAQSVVAQSAVLLSPLQGISGLELIVRRSYADYLQRWLCNLNNGY